MSPSSPKPPWLKVRAPGGDNYQRLKRTFRELDLHTVCEEARCPNVGECWREGTATVMLLGDVCTRGCRFCAVTTGDPHGFVDVREPEHVARAIARLDLQYVVMTMVNRDDLLDGGAAHVARTVERLHLLRPDILIETLVGDFCGHMSSVDTVLDAGPDVFAHNVEVVRRLTRSVRDVQSGYEQSLQVLRRAKDRIERMQAEPGSSDRPASPGDSHGPRTRRRLTKSSLMVGMGETDAEVIDTLWDLRQAGVDVVTVGQYLRPSSKHHAVLRYVPPDQFAAYERAAKDMGFLYVASGPLVRSSYRAAEVFLRGLLVATGAAEDGTSAVRAVLDDRLAVARREAARVSADGDPAEATWAWQGSPGGEHAEKLLPLSSLIRRPAS